MSTRPSCAYCGKPAPYRTTTQRFRLGGEVQAHEVPPYKGNLVVTRQTVERSYPSMGEPFTWVCRWLWDGESYQRLYDGMFCTLRHALKFATAAHKAGYRMSPSDKEHEIA